VEFTRAFLAVGPGDDTKRIINVLPLDNPSRAGNFGELSQQSSYPGVVCDLARDRRSLVSWSDNDKEFLAVSSNECVHVGPSSSEPIRRNHVLEADEARLIQASGERAGIHSNVVRERSDLRPPRMAEPHVYAVKKSFTLTWLLCLPINGSRAATSEGLQSVESRIRAGQFIERAERFSDCGVCRPTSESMLREAAGL